MSTTFPFSSYVDCFCESSKFTGLKPDSEWLGNDSNLFTSMYKVEFGLILGAIACMAKDHRITVENARNCKRTDYLLSATKAEIKDSVDNVYEYYEDIEDLFDDDAIAEDDSMDDNDIALLLFVDVPEGEIGDLFKQLTPELAERTENPMPIFNIARLFDRYYYPKETAFSVSSFHFYRGSNMFSVDEPDCIDDIVKKLAGDDCGDVYNPFEIDTTKQYLVDNEHKYYCSINDDYHYYFKLMDIYLREYHNVILEHKLCFNNWNTHNAKTIATTIPFGIVIKNEGVDKPVEEFLLDDIADDIPEDGQLIAIIPARALYDNGAFASIRQDLTDRNLLDCVILLPSGLYGRFSMATAIIHLKKGRDADAKIRMFDFSDFCDRDDEDPRYCELNIKSALLYLGWHYEDRSSKTVSRQSIIDQDYDWNVCRYTQNISDIPHGYGKAPLQDLIHPVESFDVHSFLTSRIIRADMLNEDVFTSTDFPVYSSDECIEKLSDEENLDHEFQYLEGGFLAIDFHNGIHTAWVNQPDAVLGSQVALEEGLMAYRIDPAVIDVDYLRLLLAQEYDTMLRTHQFELNNWTDVEYRMRARTVVYPLSIEEQRRLYQEAKNKHLFDEALANGLDKALEEKKTEYMNEVRMRKHEMRQYLGDLANLHTLMSLNLTNPTLDESFKSSFGSMLDQMRASIENIDLLLERFSREEVFGEPVHLNLDEELDKFIKGFNSDRFAFFYNVDFSYLDQNNKTVAISYVDDIVSRGFKENEPIDVFVDMAPEDLQSLCQNICENAVRHGFVDKSRNDYSITIDLSYDELKGMALIQFINNGKPLPKGLNASRYGLMGEKAGATAHSGMGGYVVKRIVEHYKGKYNLFSRPTGAGKFQTVVQIWLPFKTC